MTTTTNTHTPSQPTDSDRFDVVQYCDLSPEQTWTRLGRGSFGCVFRGLYLGLDVAIKEVLDSNEYDVDKYFKRECTLMKECRHPNIVQFIGLCLAPLSPPEYLAPLSFQDTNQTAAPIPEDIEATRTPPPLPPRYRRRILIISEYLPNGNLRSYILNKSLYFGWRLRLSFAIDIARALTYLHVRKCLHRDLKGENLLITENDRIKVCDFGFARLAARNEEEMRRMSYCGTDGYMSPEILVGEEFGLETDVFSLGVIFCEIAARKLVDDYTFKRTMPTFGLDAQEVRDLASEGCPSAFLDLAIACVSVEPRERPGMREVLARLQEIEVGVILADQQRRAEQENTSAGYNVGSLKFGERYVGRTISSSIGGVHHPSSHKKTRPQPGRIPSFQGSIVTPGSTLVPTDTAAQATDGAAGSTLFSSASKGQSSSHIWEDDETDEEDVDEVLARLASLQVGGPADRRPPDEAKYAKNALYLHSTENGGTSQLVLHGHSHLQDDQEEGQSKMTTYSVIKGSKISNASFQHAWSAGAKTGRGSTIATASSIFARPDTPDHDASNASTLTVKASEAVADASTGGTDEAIEEREAVGDVVEQEDKASAEPMPGALPARPEGGRADHTDAFKYATIRSLSLPITASPETRGSTYRPTSTAGSATGSEHSQAHPHPHRFTLVKPGWKFLWESESGAASSLSSRQNRHNPSELTPSSRTDIAVNPIFLPIQLLGAGLLGKCTVCEKRLGLLKPYFACDDCQQLYHTRCGDLVGPNCGASASDVGGPGTEARPSNRRLPLPIRSDSSNSNGNGKEEWSSAITGGPNSSASRSRDQLKKLKRTSLTG